MYRLAKGNFGLIDFDDAFQWFAIRIDHRAPELLCQQPSGFVGHAKLVLQLQRDMPLEWVVIRCAAQNHVSAAIWSDASPCQRDRGLPSAIKAFVQTRPAF